MNIIFLDIDGVLNTPRFQEYQINHHESDGYNCRFNFDPICMKNLKNLIEVSNAKIVLSSSWRDLNPDDKYMKCILDNFKMYKISTEIISITPFRLDNFRGREIQDWLFLRMDKIDNFVILDDDTDMGILTNKLAKCDEHFGFTKDVLNKALKIMNIEEE